MRIGTPLKYAFTATPTLTIAKSLRPETKPSMAAALVSSGVC